MIWCILYEDQTEEVEMTSQKEYSGVLKVRTTRDKRPRVVFTKKQAIAEVAPAAEEKPAKKPVAKKKTTTKKK